MTGSNKYEKRGSNIRMFRSVRDPTHEDKSGTEGFARTVHGDIDDLQIL